ncbi:MAG TPA: DUF1501 domain-containing protein [Rhodopila sp.]|uniref:DUF1501 domain-containing protein n=1 Tax=Rhodopila sp. TaxID=2480087 RepID=UPI002C1DD9A2|nr:DUF1501 domain-containing protein [Rhodopila sp.]HVY17088.1 DUF1501 domain-containing protein [Rhodopila sp.]
MRITRRGALLGLSSAIGLGHSSLALAAAPTDRRFVVIIMRGALDGMAAVVPYGDQGLAALRAPLVPPAPGQPDGLLDLGGFYGLHPAMTGMHEMFKAHEAAVVHAVAAHYRVRSHFEAQDYLESGADQRLTSGWLNRVVAALPAEPGKHPEGEALAVSVSVPLLLRGPVQVANWAPHGFGQPAPTLYAAIEALNRQDPLLGPAIRDGLAARGFSAGVMAADHDDDKSRFGFPALAKAAGEMLVAPNGPRIAALEINGWDTHTAQVNRLREPLRQLDAGLVAMKAALGPAWAQTAVLVMTEFGRTARVNGTGGTDHGTATVAFLAGGSVAGGRVLGTWPGLGEGKLFENRDLAPTTDLRAVAKGMLGGHLGLSESAMRRVFPGSDGVQGMGGLVRT